MHLYMITRGIKHEVDQFITELQGKYLPFKWRADGEKQLKDCYVQLAVRPIQLWEVVFPEDQKDVVLSTCLGGEGARGKTQHKWQQKYANFFRRILKLDPLPDYDGTKQMPIRRNGIEIVGLGLKKDYWTTLDNQHVPEKVEGAFEGL